MTPKRMTPTGALRHLPLKGGGKEGANDFSSPWKGEVGAKRRVGVTRPNRYDWTPEETKRTRELRRNATDQERVLWRVLQKGKRQGFSFRRQHPVGPFVLDFYCSPLKLAIELDGGQHAEDDEIRRDNRRTGWLKTKGITVLRFWNNDVTANLDGVVTRIDEEIARLQNAMTPTGASRHLPLPGGGKEEGR